MGWDNGKEVGLVCCLYYGVQNGSDVMDIIIGGNEMLGNDFKVLDMVVLKSYGVYNVNDDYVGLEDVFMLVDIL